MPEKIGEVNGWRTQMFKLLMWLTPIFMAFCTVVIIPFSIWVATNQIKDNEFRAAGDRYTKTQADSEHIILMQNARHTFSEMIDILRRELDKHEAKGGHSVMENRMLAIERRSDQTDGQISQMNDKLDKLLVQQTELKTLLENKP